MKFVDLKVVEKNDLWVGVIIICFILGILWE